MIELRKTALFAEWLDGLMACAMFEQGHGSRPGWSGLQGEIQAMLSLLAKVFQSCELTTVPATGYILNSGVAR